MRWNSDESISDSASRIKQLDIERRDLERRAGRATPDIETMVIGEAREFNLVVLHIDVNDYKEITNNLTKPQILRFLNTFLSEMTYLVRDYSGIVEKYVGDQVTAVFGIGKDAETAVRNSMDCAMTMLTIIKYAINPYFKTIGLPEFTCSVGMDYGNVWMARTGINNFTQFTLVGVEVSIAAQLVELAGSNEIWIGEELFTHLSDKRKGFCTKLAYPRPWIWEWYKKPYGLYRYDGIWRGFEV